MEKSCLTTLSSKGQLTIPKSIRDILKISDGQRLLLEVKEGSLTVKKVSIQEDREWSDQEWEEIRKLASRKGKRYSSGKAFLKSLKSS